MAEGFLRMSLEQYEKLDDLSAMNHMTNYMSSDLYNSFLFLNSQSLFVADKVLRINFLQQISMYCKSRPTDTTLINVLKEARLCTQNYFATLSRQSYSYFEHADLFRAPETTQLNQIKQIQDQIKATLKLPMDGLFNDITGVLGILTPRSDGASVMVPHEVYKLSAEVKFTKLSEKLYFHLMDLLIETVATNVVKGKDIFSDLTLFFRSEGYSFKESRKLSFLYLGIFASRGASILYSFPEMHPKSLSALFALSMAISYIDKVAALNGQNYAIPHQFNSTCHLGKPYHFWMAAYQSQYERNQGQTGLVSYLIPVVAGIGYDLTMTSNGRDIRKLFEIKTPFDDYANGTRLDNWARSLGAHFGRHSGIVIPLKADNILIRTFKRGQMPSKIPTGLSETIKEYVRIVQPGQMIMRLAL